MDSGNILLALAALAVTLVVYGQLTKKRLPAPLPPGPKGLPLLGNILDLPQSEPWKTFGSWGDKYGERLFRFRAAWLTVALHRRHLLRFGRREVYRRPE